MNNEKLSNFIKEYKELKDEVYTQFKPSKDANLGFSVTDDLWDLVKKGYSLGNQLEGKDKGVLRSFIDKIHVDIEYVNLNVESDFDEDIKNEMRERLVHNVTSLIEAELLTEQGAIDNAKALNKMLSKLKAYGLAKREDMTLFYETLNAKKNAFKVAKEFKDKSIRYRTAESKARGKLLDVARSIDLDSLTLENIDETRDRLFKIADIIGNMDSIGYTTIPNRYEVSNKRIELRENRMREVLEGMGMPEDTIDIAISKGMFYAYRHEALKDFSNIMKLAEAKSKAEILKNTLHELDIVDNETAIKEGMRAYLYSNNSREALLEMSEEELAQSVNNYFGHSGKFTVYATRAHWRSSVGTDDKSIFVNPFVGIRFTKIK